MFSDKILAILFPPTCLGCRTAVPINTVFCETCAKSVCLNKNLFCGRCGARIPGKNKVCHKYFPYILGAAAQYDSAPVKNLVRSLKFNRAKRAAEPLAAFLVEYASALALPLEGFVVIPVPLSRARLRQRGFNQSELIARIFARHFSLRLDTRSLIRTKNAGPQSETGGLAERKENIRSCFEVCNPDPLRGENIILIDDVTTSGATLYEAASVLKSSGAGKIIALAAARA